MDSDASLIEGEYLQDHQLATYQSLGQLDGIDLQYNSLQAYPEPVVNGALTVNTDTGSGTFTSATLAMTVGGTSQGTPSRSRASPVTGPT